MMNPSQLLGMLNKAKNPLGILNQIAENNPQLQRVIEIINGKSPKELEQFVRNTAQTQGVDLSQLAKKLGIQLPQ